MRQQKYNENLSKPTQTLLIHSSFTTVLSHLPETRTKHHESLETYRLLGSSVNESAEYRSRHSTDLLWLPYIILTLILTSLLVASFVHFHCKNGHKYQRRRSPSTQTGRDWRQKIVENALMTNQTTSVDLYGALRSWTSDPDLKDDVKTLQRGLLKSDVMNYTTPIRSVRETEDQYSNELRSNLHRVHPSRPPPSGRAPPSAGPPLSAASSSSLRVSVGDKDPTIMQSHVTSSRNHHHRPGVSGPLHPTLSNSPSDINKSTSASSSGVIVCNVSDNRGGDHRKQCHRSGAGGEGPGVRAAQEYVSNRNGSMVNMRCGRPENVITFQDINRTIKRSSSSYRTSLSGREAADPSKLSTIASISSNRTWSSSNSRDGMENLQGGGRQYVNIADGRSRIGVLGEGRDGAKALYSATKICRMDGTDDDWRVLQSHSQL